MKMREININIEGYNVNGICIGCLNYSRKMSHKDEIGDVLKLLCNIEVPSGISLQICWECQAHLANVKKFQKQILKSYDVLSEYSRQQTFLDCPTDFTKHATTRFSINKLNPVNVCIQHGSLKTTCDSSNFEDENVLKAKVEIDTEAVEKGATSKLEDVEIEEADGVGENKLDYPSGVEAIASTSGVEEIPAFHASVSPGGSRRIGNETELLVRTPEGIVPWRPPPPRTPVIGTPDCLTSTPIAGVKTELEDTETEGVDVVSGVKTELEDIETGVDGVSEYEDPTKNETDSSEKLVNLMPDRKKTKSAATKRKKKLRKKTRPSENDYDKLKSAIRTVKTTEEDVIREREELRSNVDFITAEYKCYNCLVHFKNKEDCDTHNELKHNVNGNYSCPVCKTVSSNQSSHEDHYQTHFTRYECVLCGQRWRYSDKKKVNYKELQLHMAAKHSCDICGVVYFSKLDQEKHTSHKSRIKCPLCERTFSHRAGLMNHRMAMHEGKVEFPCEICNKVFRWKNSLKRHMEKHDEKTSQQTPAAYCETCHISFNYICSYQRHLRNSLKHVTHDQLRFICDHCGRKFADKTKLRYHIEEKHLHKTYHCDICLKPSRNRSHLEQHVRNVHVGRPLDKMCNHCGKGFPTKVQLESHLRTHTGERPFICEHCPTTFTQQSNLYKHRRQVHLNIKSKRYPTLKKKKEDINQPVTDQYQMSWT